ncbi:MAG: hypothetical protein Q9227_005834 [Pyrenula ochraceoflavens]
MTLIKPRKGDLSVPLPNGKGGICYMTVSDPPPEAVPPSSTTLPTNTSSSDPSSPYLVRMVSPVGSYFQVPPHYHPLTTEFFRVLVGTASVTIDNHVHTITPDSGELRIPAGSVHSIDVPTDVHVEMCERVDRDPVKKAKFLYSLLGGGDGRLTSGLEALALCYKDGDGFPSTGWGLLDKMMVYGGGGLGAMLGYGKPLAA